MIEMRSHNYVLLCPIVEDDQVTTDVLYISEGDKNEELAEHLEAFARYLRRNPGMTIFVSID